MKIFVGGLSYEVMDEDLKALFTPHGQVDSAAVVTDRHSGQPRGFGFVEMPERREAIAAIAALNGTQLQGRTLEVNEARPPEKRPFGGGQRGRPYQRQGKRPGGGNRRRF
jgi:cold-inducible RNA-binding protein